ncbi:ras-like GTP-binding protein Rho1 [Zopfochytrium polystomum]|nr:ras-like GTP-binding protein Rho1 [Zopfochytrium polystomum]
MYGCATGPLESSGKTSLRKKLVVAGDPSVGKTTLLLACKIGFFPTAPVPRVTDVHNINVPLDDKSEVQLFLWDTCDEGDYSRLRPLAYPSTDVILACFSIGSPKTLRSLEHRWIEEFAHFATGAPVVLVGCKKDLRGDSNIVAELTRDGKHPVTFAEGHAMARKLRARYVECSAKTNEGVSDVFKTAGLKAVEFKRDTIKRAKRANRCNLL